MIKIRGGREWRDLTALTYHHETQPMPGPLSRQAHLLPRWFHKGEVLGNHFAQLVVPWFLFAPILGLWVPGPVPAIVGAVAAGDRHRDPALARRDGQLRLAELGDDRARRSRRSALPGLGSRSPSPSHRRRPGVIDGLPLVWLIATVGGRRALRRPELAGAAQPVRAAAS